MRLRHSIACWVDVELLEGMLARGTQRHQVCDGTAAHKQTLELRIETK